MTELPTSIPPVPLSIAARILRSTPAAINEAIAKKLYGCAPETVPGSRRIFQEHDIIGLRIYHHLCGNGLTYRDAGQIACIVMNWVLADVPPALELAEVRFPANFSYPHGIAVYRDADGNLVDSHGSPPKTDRELGSRSSLTIAVDLHIEDVRAVFKQLVDNGTVIIVKKPRPYEVEESFTCILAGEGA